MDKLTFGFTMMIVGTGGTMLTLWILSLLVTLLKKIFPIDLKEAPTEKKK